MRVTDPLAHLSGVLEGDHASSINSSPRHSTEKTTFCLPLGRVFLVCPPPQEKKKTWGSSFRVSLPKSCYGATGIASTVLCFPMVHEGLGSLAECGTTQC